MKPGATPALNPMDVSLWEDVCVCVFSLAVKETEEPERVRSPAAERAEPSMVTALPALSVTSPPSEATTEGVQLVEEDEDASERDP